MTENSQDLASARDKGAVSGIYPSGHDAKGWLGRILDWFRFVHYRKPDTSHRVFPEAYRLVLLIMGLTAITVLLVRFADPIFLETVRQPGWRPERAFRLITEFGASDWFIYTAGAALILYSLIRPGGMLARERHLAHTLMLAVYFFFTTIAFSGLITNLIKLCIGRLRPMQVDLSALASDGAWQIIPFTRGYDHASFPSGHATTAGAAAVALALLFPRLRALFIVAGIWVATSRPALGVHFPSDVFVGFCIGAGFTWYYARSFARKRLLFGFEENGGILPRYRLPSRAVEAAKGGNAP